MKIEAWGIHYRPPCVYHGRLFYVESYLLERKSDGELAFNYNYILGERNPSYSYKDCYMYIKSKGMPYLGLNMEDVPVTARQVERILRDKLTLKERFFHLLWMAGL